MLVYNGTEIPRVLGKIVYNNTNVERVEYKESSAANPVLVWSLENTATITTHNDTDNVTMSRSGNRVTVNNTTTGLKAYIDWDSNNNRTTYVKAQDEEYKFNMGCTLSINENYAVPIRVRVSLTSGDVSYGGGTVRAPCIQANVGTKGISFFNINNNIIYDKVISTQNYSEDIYISPLKSNDTSDIGASSSSAENALTALPVLIDISADPKPTLTFEIIDVDTGTVLASTSFTHSWATPLSHTLTY